MVPRVRPSFDCAGPYRRSARRDKRPALRRASIAAPGRWAGGPDSAICRRRPKRPGRSLLQRSRCGGRPLLALLLGILLLGGSAWAGDGEPAAGTPSAPRTSKTPAPGLDELIALHRLAGARISLLIVDARSGAVIAARAPDDPLPPASTAKLLTAEAALEVLGPEHRFTTELLTTGPVVNGVLRGDVVLRGGGDPDLQVPDLLELATALPRAGIKRIEGRLVVDDSLLPHPSSIGADDFPPDDAYNAGIGALTVGFDRVRLRWRRDPDGSGAVEAWTIPPLAEAGIALAPPRALPRGAVASEVDPRGRSTWLLAHERPAAGSIDLPVRDSGLQAGALFRAFSARLGARLPPPVRGTPAGPLQRLAAHESRPLVGMVGDMLRYSNNQMAELIGLATSRRLAGHGLDLEASAAAVLGYLEAEIPALKAPAAILPNHSGLAGGARLTARQLVALLAHGLGDRPDVPSLAPLLPTGGFDGTLDRRFDGAAQVLDVWAKTGTLDGVSTLAGYLLDPDRPAARLRHHGRHRERTWRRRQGGALRPPRPGPRGRYRRGLAGGRPSLTYSGIAFRR